MGRGRSEGLCRRRGDSLERLREDCCRLSIEVTVFGLGRRNGATHQLRNRWNLGEPSETQDGFGLREVVNDLSEAYLSYCQGTTCEVDLTQTSEMEDEAACFLPASHQ